MVVLVVIGVGVGFVGGLTYPKVPSRFYGHPPYTSRLVPVVQGLKVCRVPEPVGVLEADQPDQRSNA